MFTNKENEDIVLRSNHFFKELLNLYNKSVGHFIFYRGFTLIELLIVIAILGIIIAAVIAGIDPVDKINAANDAKVEADIGSIGTAMEAYAALNGGSYATSLGALTSSGDLKVVLTPPTTNYSAYSSTLGCTTAPCTSQTLWSQQKSKRFSARPFWMWCSTTGHSAATAATTTCP